VRIKNDLILLVTSATAKMADDDDDDSIVALPKNGRLWNCNINDNSNPKTTTITTKAA
jgi:hypothetical protein